MNKTALTQYLENIEKNKAINLGQFLKLIEPCGWSENQLRKILGWKKIKGDKYQIHILDKLAFETLKADFHLPKSSICVSDRVHASIAGNSHTQRVSGSLLTLLGHAQSFPQLIVFDKDGGYQTPASLHHNLLVIENLENFLALIKCRDYLVSWLGLEPNQAWDCDIVYADGNAISNKLHQQFFCHYDTIRCLLDIDLGGFEIFKNIYALLADNYCEFVLSEYYLNQYLQYGKPINAVDYSKLTSRHYPKNLQQALDTVLKYKKFAEQEILLWD